MASRRTRPGSPIGRKGPRKANPKYKQRSGEPWEASEVKELKSLAKQNTPHRRHQPEAQATPNCNSQ